MIRSGANRGQVASMSDERHNSRNGILSLTIKDKAVLYSAYMPFLQYGGLFVPTNKAYDIG